MAIVRNIGKVIVPAYGKGPKDVIKYINEQAWSTGADIGSVSLNGDFYSVVGANGVITIVGGVGNLKLQATINATATEIPITTVTVSGTPSLFPLSIWPASGYFRIDDEIIQYTSINPKATSASGYDEFQLSSAALRGVKDSVAASHTATVSGPLITEVLIGVVSNMEFNNDTGVFNIWTRTTQSICPDESYGADGYTDTVTTHLIPCPEDVVTFFEIEGVSS